MSSCEHVPIFWRMNFIKSYCVYSEYIGNREPWHPGHWMSWQFWLGLFTHQVFKKRSMPARLLECGGRGAIAPTRFWQISTRWEGRLCSPNYYSPPLYCSSNLNPWTWTCHDCPYLAPNNSLSSTGWVSWTVVMKPHVPRGKTPLNYLPLMTSDVAAHQLG